MLTAALLTIVKIWKPPSVPHLVNGKVNGGPGISHSQQLKKMEQIMDT